MASTSTNQEPGTPSSTVLLVALLVALVVLIFNPSPGSAREWTGTLEGGGTVAVDPRTNRATVVRGGVRSQLWDGVHQLQDGTTLTIRSGIAVPTESILQSRQPVREDQRPSEWIGAPIVGYSPCERLVRDVCGSKDECAAASGCGPAKQLLEMENQERQANTTPNIMTFSSAQCQEASKDRLLFIGCGQTPAASETASASAQSTPTVSPCQQLVFKVCGRDDACAGQEACDAAKQMVFLEEQDQVNNRLISYNQNPASAQCRQILVGDAFFKACGTP